MPMPTSPQPWTTDDARWQAVATRDRAADGAFVFAVRTTGVYCRPGCGARVPRREHVSFHPDPAAARSAGFRACRRCRPDEGSQDERHGSAVAAACRLIEQSETMPPLADLATAAGLSPSHFHRLFRAAMGCTPRDYAAARRAARMQDALSTAPSVTDAIYAAGFGAPSRFYAAADGALGMAPTAYRAGGVGEVIRFAVGDTSLGAVLVAATAKGVCAVLIGEEPDALARDLQDRFPRAELVGADPDFEQVVASVLVAVERPGAPLYLPLDIRGTAFQERVWRALRAIPAGETVSYAALADRIGTPAAVRAVAGACAANPLAVLVPCHRVVRTDGALSGYRWGVERKRALLDREHAAVDAG